MPVYRDLFMMSVRKGRSGTRYDLSSDVGSGSMLQLLDGVVIMIHRIMCSDVGSVSMLQLLDGEAMIHLIMCSDVGSGSMLQLLDGEAIMIHRIMCSELAGRPWVVELKALLLLLLLYHLFANQVRNKYM